MKMKEVLKVTGLTDRAVRLYIEKELIYPENEKSYTGRNNLNFSESDVQLLKKIANLRKAGFSIQQIKCIQSDSEQAQLALNELLETKEKEQELNQKVIEALSPLRGRDRLDIDIISDSLENSVKHEKVPKADMKRSTGEIVERIIVMSFSGLLLFLNLLPGLFFTFSFLSSYRFIRLYTDRLEYHLLIAIAYFTPIVLLIAVLILYLIPKYNKKFRITRGVISGVLICLSIIAMCTTSFIAFLLVSFIPPVYSQTTDPSDYLLLDDYVEYIGRDDILDLFPDYIPRSAVIEDEYDRLTGKYPETTKYYYIHEHQVDDSYDIVAEWQLPEEEYEEAKEDIFNRQDEIIGTETKGNWQLVHFTEDLNRMITDGYYFVVFAYNDETNTVRYIVSFCQDAADGALQPYYFSLDW